MQRVAADAMGADKIVTDDQFDRVQREQLSWIHEAVDPLVPPHVKYSFVDLSDTKALDGENCELNYIDYRRGIWFSAIFYQSVSVPPSWSWALGPVLVDKGDKRSTWIGDHLPRLPERAMIPTALDAALNGTIRVNTFRLGSLVVARNIQLLSRGGTVIRERRNSLLDVLARIHILVREDSEL